MGTRTRITLNDFRWADLFEQVRHGECTPFIGAGASAGTLPLAQGLAQALVVEDEAETGRACPLPEPRDLARVCQYLAVTHENGVWPKRKIAEKIIAAGHPDFTARDEPHAALAALPLPIYLTTNYDDFMLAALRQRTARARQELARWHGALLRGETSSFDEGYRPTAEEPVVFHLHGHTRAPRAMVATEDDYVDFLVNISKDLANSPTGRRARAMLPLPIRTAITNNTLLFVGYGLSDINFRVILRGLVGSLERSQRLVSLAIQYSEGNPKELEDYLEEYFRWTLEIRVFWGSARDFAGALRERWAAYAGER